MSDEKKRPDEPLSLSGRTIAGRYRVVGVVGQGGIGKVYEAEQIGLDRTVAVKAIRPERRNDEVTTRRFLREARAAGRIASAHVVTLFDCGTDAATGELYIAMELLQGQSLSARLSHGDSIPLPELLRVGAMIARGLRAAHEAGVLHRDLKPANVHLCDDGNVKVLDFGIAKILDDQLEPEPLTKVNRILGTPVYMSPEAARRQPLGPTTDLYALGLILYEMVVGAPPFKTGDAWKTLEAQVKTTPPRLSAAAPWRAIPAGLDALVAKLLRKRPEERPRDAGEVAATLDRLATEAAIAEAQVDDLTEVSVRVPTDARETPPDVEVSSSDTTDPSLADEPGGPPESMEATEVWLGSRMHRVGGPPPEIVGRPFPKEELEAYQRSLKKPDGKRFGTRELALAAALAGGLTFVVMLALRLLL